MSDHNGTSRDPSDDAPDDSSRGTALTQPVGLPERNGMSPVSPRRPQWPPLSGRRSGRDLAAGATALILVALFVALFGALAARGRGGPASSGNPTTTTSADATGTTAPGATPTPTEAAGVASGTLTHVARLDGTSEPVVSPSDPSVAYVVVNQNTITRVSGGASTAIPSPAALAQYNYQWLDLAISPLSSETLFATASLTDATGNYLTQGCPVSPPVTLAAPAGGNLLASPKSGSIPCQVQFVTTDGGQSWHMMHLPANLLLGNTSAAMGIGMYSAPPAVVNKEQLVDVASIGPLGSATVHLLLTSTDGGLTWQKFPLPMSGYGGICSVAASPTGTAIYIVVTSNGCSAATEMYYPSQELWRATYDGRAWNWAMMNAPSANYVDAFAPTTQGPLYALTGVGQSHTSSTAGPQDIFVSINQGKSWRQAPAAGVPHGAVWPGAANEGTSPLPVVLPNGALVVPFTSPTGASGLYEWKAGSATWQQIVALPAKEPNTVAITASPGTSGGEVFSLVQSDGIGNPSASFQVDQFTLASN